MQEKKETEDHADHEQSKRRDQYDRRTDLLGASPHRLVRPYGCQCRQRCKNDRSDSGQQQPQDRHRQPAVSRPQRSGRRSFGWRGVDRCTLLWNAQHNTVCVENPIQLVGFFQVGKKGLSIQYFFEREKNNTISILIAWRQFIQAIHTRDSLLQRGSKGGAQ